jgi:2Fe-2S ferredoxin
MPKLTIVTPGGAVRTVDAESNRTVMETIRDAGVDELQAICGGCCSCATCHVFVAEAYASRLPPMSADEDALLSGSEHRGPASRLSCQIRVSEELDGLSVTIAPPE